MDKIIFIIIGLLFLTSCETKMNPNTTNIAIKDSTHTTEDDSITYALRPLSKYIDKGFSGPKKIQDILLSFPEIKNILNGNKDTTGFDVNLYVFGGTEKKDKSGQVESVKFSKNDFIVCLWAINRKTLKETRYANFHFNLNTMNSYVIDSIGQRMSIEVWREKQHTKK